MDEKSITDYIINTFAGIETTTTLGYTFFFYGPDRMSAICDHCHRRQRGRPCFES